ncbi:hypothetical protein GIB67_019331 [Kingdonia uniflora]|uniref:Uncharacterized protein n=1 Tax=Kingdonia uniflora TaxID=39325 RepID=A0A7J7M1I2_9MAGN|nr:hypothetical protein GIB67_019331 [Kingdonia uniflora]
MRRSVLDLFAPLTESDCDETWRAAILGHREQIHSDRTQNARVDLAGVRQQELLCKAGFGKQQTVIRTGCNSSKKQGVALALSIWGFISYFYGEFKQSKNLNKQTRPNTGSTTDDSGVTSLNQEYEIGFRSDRELQPHSTSMRVAPE